MNKEYLEFLDNKRIRLEESGFDILESDLNPMLFDFQKFGVRQALKKGKYALFEAPGLGKTPQQLEWAFQVVKHTNKPVLILAPLGVSNQTIREGKKFNIDVTKFAGDFNEAKIYITNYEQLENIRDIAYLLGGVVMDESSILKNFEGAIRNLAIELFAQTPFKLACTATPSPNDPMELGNHSEWLNVMPRNEMLAMYFVHDGGDTQKWRLKGHCEQLFWDWVSTWAICFSKPQDIGFNAVGYDLPELNYIERQIKTPQRNNGQLFNDVAVSATNFNAELRLTKVERLSEVISIVNNSTENFVIWIKQNEEGEYLRKHIKGAVEVSGSDENDVKEKRLLYFAENKIRVLITKTKIAGFGMNYQNCHNTIFASPDFSFESIFQAIRRFLRFGQEQAVNAYLITTDTMVNVIGTFKRKEQQHENMQAAMVRAMNRNLQQTKTIKMEREFKEVVTPDYTLQLGDCVQLIANIPDESIGFSIFSPPFSDLYTYSDELEDMGNSKDYIEFMFAFKILAKELYRVLLSGRNVAIHCADLPIQKGKEGFIGLRDFSNMIREAFEEVGFIYHSRCTLWKDPVTEMQRTKALGLLHKQIKKDATMSRVGIPDYLLVFRKDGERLHPVKHQDTDPTKPNYLSVDMWQQIASPVWMDIDYGNTLNGRLARGDKDEKHICPLQLETIERAVLLYTNEGDTVLTPFGGIMSEAYQAVLMNRKAIAFELKESYFNLGVKNMKDAMLQKTQKKIF